MSQIVIGVPLLPGESLGDVSAFGECELVAAGGTLVFGVRRDASGGLTFDQIVDEFRTVARTAQRIGMQLTDDDGAERQPWVWRVD